MSQNETGDWGDLENGDRERDLGSHGRPSRQPSRLHSELTAARYIAGSLAEGLRRIDAARAEAFAEDCEEPERTA